MKRPPRIAVGLAAVYLMTLGSTDPIDLVMGLVLGTALVAALGDRLRLGPGGRVPDLARRAVWLPVFVGAVVREIIVGTYDVALRVLHLRPTDRPGIVRIPIGRRSERGVAVSGLAITLSPGTVLVDVDWERGSMLLHVFDASDPEELRRRSEEFYERFQCKVFP